MPEQNTLERIEQFQKMVDSDPTNEMGYFGLGSALLEAGRSDDAASALSRAVELNPNFLGALELLAKAQLAGDRKEAAIETLKQAYEVAARRNETRSAEAVRKQLAELGVGLEALAAAQPVSAEGFQCRRCGRTEGKLAEPPMNNAIGREVAEKVCSDCWQQWMLVSVKLINELGLNLVHPQARAVWDQHMREFLNL